MSITTASQSRLDAALGPQRIYRWTGVPGQGLLLRRTDAIAIPLSLLWCGLAIVWESMVIISRAPLLMWLWGVPFILMGLYVVAGRFILDMYFRAHTTYAVSDDAIYIVRDGFAAQTTVLAAPALTPIELRRRPDGSGSIVFGVQLKALSAIYGWPLWGFGLPPAFERIPDVDYVYHLVEGIATRR